MASRPRLKPSVDSHFLGNSGIGYETSLQLAQSNARVYIAGRSTQRLEEAITSMRGSIDSNQVLDIRPLKIDLSNLQSIINAAKHFQQIESQLHLLVNNAGV